VSLPIPHRPGDDLRGGVPVEDQVPGRVRLEPADVGPPALMPADVADLHAVMVDEQEPAHTADQPQDIHPKDQVLQMNPRTLKRLM
jgi:hypothetical protein